MVKTLANNQPQNKKIQRKARQQVNHNLLATTLTQKIPRLLAPMISTWMLPEWHFMNSKLNYSGRV